jgi:photosystem II stability/assembly factor-like uncharacterized protein
MRALSILAAAVFAFAAGPPWVNQRCPVEASLRGVSAVDVSTAWAGGTKGAVLRTTDGGANWIVRPVVGAEELDFRDVEAFDAQRAIILSSGPGAQSRIYRTTDGGERWTLAHQNTDSSGFFDAIAFWDTRRGLAVGDPVDGRFVLLRTEDGGANWRRIDEVGMPPAHESEGAFAASGTCLAVDRNGRAWFGTGGVNGGRVFRSADWGQTWAVVETPIRHDSPSSGIFSLVFRGEHGVAVGGDYQKPEEDRANVIVSDDGGRTWTVAGGTRPRGYRSAAAYSGQALIATGPNGTDRSEDGGNTWRSEQGAAGFNALSFVDGAGWAVGARGAIARWRAR